jgi:eukaryotic-like serine/threonine-protein kinase
MLDFDDPEELIGATLDGRWRLVRVVGQGGIGVVFEAESLERGGRYALKILRSEFCESEDIVSRFLSEVQASVRVDHPCVARVYEAVRAADGTPYLVMELLEGQPLANRMNRGRVPVEQATAIVQNILAALTVAHAAGVIHRDLKPGNVFLLGDQVTGTDVKLLDFGIALVLDAAGGMQRKTRTGMLLGTPGYMSPEQIRSIKQADQRADLWSVGIIFYELLAGVPAFEADNEFARVTKVLTSEPVPIENAAPQFAHWGPFFKKALAREPGQRFQSAAEMSAALEHVARHGQMPGAGPNTRESPAWSGAAGGFNPSTSEPNRGSAPPPGHFASQPPGSAAASGGGYVSAPPPAVSSAPRRFGGDTAVSAGTDGAPSTRGEPSVEIVQVPKRGFQLPLGLVLMIAVIALLVGFTVGVFVGKI